MLNPKRLPPGGAFFVIACLFGAWSQVASAHGRPPSIQELRFHPSDPQRIVGEATWGLVFSDDGGQSWGWICAAAYGVDARMEDPHVAWGADGSILLGLKIGLTTAYFAMPPLMILTRMSR